MRRRIVFSVAVLIAVLATPSTTTPPEPEFRGRRRSGALVPAGCRAGPRRCAVQPREHVLWRAGRSQGRRACAHVVNIAGVNGDEDARESRDRLKRDMTRAEISRAIELARECMDANDGTLLDAAIQRAVPDFAEVHLLEASLSPLQLLTKLPKLSGFAFKTQSLPAVESGVRDPHAAAGEGVGEAAVADQLQYIRLELRGQLGWTPARHQLSSFQGVADDLPVR